MERIRAISLHQPFADLIAMGNKTVETRGWATTHRGLLLICAAKKYDKEVKANIQIFQEYDYWFDREPLLPADYKPRLGVAVARANVVDCQELWEGKKDVEKWRRASCLPKLPGWKLDGLWGWVLTEIEPIDPFPIKGRQRLFWHPPNTSQKYNRDKKEPSYG